MHDSSKTLLLLARNQLEFPKSLNPRFCMLRWIYKLLAIVPPDERGGLSLNETSCWMVQGGVGDFSDFVRALPLLVPQGSILHIEGGAHSKELTAFLNSRMLSPRCKIELGTIWPSSHIYHLPTDEGFLNEFATMTEECALPEVCDHLAIYKNGIVLVQCYDAMDDPIFVSKQLSLEVLDAFCKKIGGIYEDASDEG